MAILLNSGVHNFTHMENNFLTMISYSMCHDRGISRIFAIIMTDTFDMQEQVDGFDCSTVVSKSSYGKYTVYAL